MACSPHISQNKLRAIKCKVCASYRSVVSTPFGEDRVRVGSYGGSKSPPESLLLVPSISDLTSSEIKSSYPVPWATPLPSPDHLTLLFFSTLGVSSSGLFVKELSLSIVLRTGVISKEHSLVSPATRPKLLWREKAVREGCRSVSHLELRFCFFPCWAYLSLRDMVEGGGESEESRGPGS